MDGGAGDIFYGSSGTLVAAALETAGYYLQQSSLRVIEGGYGRSLGGFLFVIALLTAAVIFSFGGQYKFFRWLLIGPGIFYFVIFSRVETSGVEWRFGGEGRGNTLVQSLNEGVTDTEEQANVSWIFARWNQFTSTLVQGFVQVILLMKDSTERDMDALLTKTQRYRALMTLDVADNDVSKFLSMVFFSKCSEYMRLNQQLHSDVPGGLDHLVREDIERLKPRAMLSSIDTEYQLVLQLVERKLLADTYLPVPGNEGPAVRSYTCDELWTMSVDVMRAWAQQQSVKFGDEYLDRLVTKFRSLNESDEQARRELINTIALTAFMRFGQQHVSAMTNQPKTQGNIRNLVNLREDKLGYDGHERHRPDHDIRLMNVSYEYQGKGEFMNSMLSMPYAQGLVLYFLAWLFPWFAFLLLLPGRHMGFLHWFGLWFWVKSWDIGYAIVLVFDDLLFYLLPSGAAMSDESVSQISTALQLLGSVDPTYSAQLHYLIMAMLIAAVPPLSAFLVKGASGDIITALSQGFSTFNRQAGISMASHVRNAGTQRAIIQAEDNKFAAGKQTIDSMKNSPIFFLGAMGSLATPALQSMVTAASKSTQVLGDPTAPGGSRTLGQTVRGVGLSNMVKENTNKATDYITSNFIATVSHKLQQSEWYEGLSERNLNLDRDARMFKFYSHHIMDAGFEGPLMTLYKERVTYPWAKSVEGLPFGVAWAQQGSKGAAPRK